MRILVHHSNSRMLLRVIFLTGLISVASGLLAVHDHPFAAAAGEAGFDRTGANEIRETVDKVLQDPRYTPRVDVRQRLLRRLQEWALSRLRLRGGLGKAAFWTVVLVGGFILLIALAFSIYSLFIVFRRGSLRTRGTSEFPFDEKTLEGLSYDDFIRLMKEASAKAEFRIALRYMMYALLRKLDDLRRLSFHPSKTNGDYMLEYPTSNGGYTDFRDFVRDFDNTIYGGLECGPEDFARMSGKFEKAKDNAKSEE